MRKTFMVTGAAGGMGSAVVAALVAREANVICVDVDVSALDVLMDSLERGRGRTLPVTADLCVESEIARALDEGETAFGGLDGLFNVAGAEGPLVWLHEMEVEDFDRTLRINAVSVFLTMRLVVPRLAARGGGRIVNTGSYAAVRATRGTSAYGAAKHAVIGLTRSIALEYALQGVRANVVCPGAMNTRMITSMFTRLAPDDPARGEEIVRSLTPTRALVEPSELADTGAWLLFDAPEQLTGQVLMVDGGRTAG